MNIVKEEYIGKLPLEMITGTLLLMLTILFSIIGGIINSNNKLPLEVNRIVNKKTSKRRLEIVLVIYGVLAIICDRIYMKAYIPNFIIMFMYVFFIYLVLKSIIKIEKMLRASTFEGIIENILESFKTHIKDICEISRINNKYNFANEVNKIKKDITVIVLYYNENKNSLSIYNKIDYIKMMYDMQKYVCGMFSAIELNSTVSIKKIINDNWFTCDSMLKNIGINTKLPLQPRGKEDYEWISDRIENEILVIYKQLIENNEYSTDEKELLISEVVNMNERFISYTKKSEKLTNDLFEITINWFKIENKTEINETLLNFVIEKIMFKYAIEIRKDLNFLEYNDDIFKLVYTDKVHKIKGLNINEFHIDKYIVKNMVLLTNRLNNEAKIFGKKITPIYEVKEELLFKYIYNIKEKYEMLLGSIYEKIEIIINNTSGNINYKTPTTLKKVYDTLIESIDNLNNKINSIISDCKIDYQNYKNTLNMEKVENIKSLDSRIREYNQNMVAQIIKSPWNENFEDTYGYFYNISFVSVIESLYENNYQKFEKAIKDFEYYSKIGIDNYKIYLSNLDDSTGNILKTVMDIYIDCMYIYGIVFFHYNITNNYKYHESAKGIYLVFEYLKNINNDYLNILNDFNLNNYGIGAKRYIRDQFSQNYLKSIISNNLINVEEISTMFGHKIEVITENKFIKSCLDSERSRDLFDVLKFDSICMYLLSKKQGIDFNNKYFKELEVEDYVESF
jgi:hypothetical protein